MNKLGNHVDKLQKEMKAIWCVNKLVMEHNLPRRLKFIIRSSSKNIVKTKLVGTKGRLWEFKLVVQTLEQHIIEVETKFDETLN